MERDIKLLKQDINLSSFKSLSRRAQLRPPEFTIIPEKEWEVEGQISANKLYDLYRAEYILSQLQLKKDRGELSDREYLAYNRAQSQFTVLVDEFHSRLEFLTRMWITGHYRAVLENVFHISKERLDPIVESFMVTGQILSKVRLPKEYGPATEVYLKMIKVLPGVRDSYILLRDATTLREKWRAIQQTLMTMHVNGILADLVFPASQVVQVLDFLSNVPQESLEQWMRRASVTQRIPQDLRAKSKSLSKRSQQTAPSIFHTPIESPTDVEYNINAKDLYDLYRSESVVSQLRSKFEQGELSDTENVMFHRAQAEFQTLVDKLFTLVFNKLEEWLTLHIKSLVMEAVFNQQATIEDLSQVDVAADVFKETGDLDGLCEYLEIDMDKLWEYGNPEALKDAQQVYTIMKNTPPVLQSKFVAIQQALMIVHSSGILGDYILGPNAIAMLDWLSNVPPQVTESWKKW